MSWIGNIKSGIKSTAYGMRLTLRHLFEARKSRADRQIENADFFDLKTGNVTIQYPHQTINIPDNGRYQLDCEIDDCIVCDKCAKVCPVDCIEIEAIKSPELIRTTSDGSPVRLHAAKFDIDLAKCCFCGLCTTVCPTECLTMNAEYDYSVLDITQLNFAFANLTAEEAQEKRDLYEQFVAEKNALKNTDSQETKPTTSESAQVKPVFRPGMKPATTENVEKPTEANTESKPKPVFRPGMKPVSSDNTNKTDESNTENKPKVVFRPGMKPQNGESKSTLPTKELENDATQNNGSDLSSDFKDANETANKILSDSVATPSAEIPTKKVFKPTLKPKNNE